jgi:hypothetical protein
MKTLRNISALSFMLLFAVVTVMASNSNINSRVIPATQVVHQVTVMALPDKAFCGTYHVELRNQAGDLVAPAKPFVPGQSTYLFAEKADGKGFEGARTAWLRQVSGTGTSQCTVVATADPSTVKGLFEPGKVYTYPLYVKMKPAKE